VEEKKENKIYINPYKLFVGAFIPNWLLCRREISFGGKLCYAKLCQYAGKDGECFPKQTAIALDIGCDQRQVRRYIKELLKAKLIDVCKVGFQGKNIYKFLQHEWMMMVGSMRTDVSSLERPKEDKNGLSKRTNLVRPIYEENQLRESIESIYRLWNDSKIIAHRDINKFAPAIATTLRAYKPEEIKQAISNYATVVNGDKYFWKYKWTLDQFLGRKNGMDRFLPGNFEESDYLKNTGNNSQLHRPVITDRQLEERFGRIATKEMIKGYLKTIPQEGWWMVDKYLRKRYKESNGIDEVERELIAEARKNQDQLAGLTAGIGKAV